MGFGLAATAMYFLREYLLYLVLAWGIKQALIEPLGMTVLMQVFFKVTEGQVANPEWEAKLERVSGKFAKLKDKATDWVGGSGDKASPDQAAAE